MKMCCIHQTSVSVSSPMVGEEGTEKEEGVVVVLLEDEDNYKSVDNDERWEGGGEEAGEGGGEKEGKRGIKKI